MARREDGKLLIPDDIKVLTFELALAELENIVQSLESGDVDLEASIEMYSRGALLKKHCEAKLISASERVEKIIMEDEGGVGRLATADVD